MESDLKILKFERNTNKDFRICSSVGERPQFKGRSWVQSPSYPTVMVPEWSKGRCAWLKRALGLTVSTQDTSESMVAHD